MLTAEEILRDELWLNEENYMSHDWKRFISLIENYNDDDVDELQSTIDRLERDVSDLEDERDELQEKVDELTDELDKLKDEISEITNSINESK